MPAYGVYMVYGLKISESDLSEKIKEFKEDDKSEEDDFNMYDFQSEVNEYLDGKYKTKIECFFIPCCAHKKVSDWIIGVDKQYANIYKLEGFSLPMPTEEEIADLKIIKRVFKIKVKVFPQWYAIADECMSCT